VRHQPDSGGDRDDDESMVCTAKDQEGKDLLLFFIYLVALL
jgi:hypothetical protein